MLQYFFLSYFNMLLKVSQLYEDFLKVFKHNKYLQNIKNKI